jgi:hypothetical protein
MLAVGAAATLDDVEHLVSAQLLGAEIGQNSCDELSFAQSAACVKRLWMAFAQLNHSIFRLRGARVVDGLSWLTNGELSNGGASRLLIGLHLGNFCFGHNRERIAESQVELLEHMHQDREVDGHERAITRRQSVQRRTTHLDATTLQPPL